MMDFKMIVVGISSVATNKQEKQPDGTTKVVTENITRISCRNDQSDMIQFTVSYDAGKVYELGKAVGVAVTE